MGKREIDLSKLPKWMNNGSGKATEGTINWIKSIGYKIKFIYDDIEGELEIIGYIPKNQKLTILYNDNEFEMFTGNFQKCKLGKMLNKHTKNFKIEIDTIFKDDKRDLIITDREIRKDKYGKQWKYYKCTCNKCGWTEGWIEESSLLHGQTCSCCCIYSATSVLGINTIWDTDPWMIPIINDDEFCKTHTHGCSEKIYPTCPDCGRTKSKKMRISTIYSNKSIFCSCSDKNFISRESNVFCS